MPRLLYSLLLVSLAACYQPSYEEGVACGPGGACPDGLTCRADSRCRSGEDPADSGPGVDPRDGAGGALADGGQPDAAPVACSGDGACQVPPTLCQLPGTCDLEAGLCVFPAVDCSSLDGECARGACDLASGSCTAEPINQDALCGEPARCGPFSACASDGVGDACDPTGVQMRSCEVSRCQAGTCARDPVIESASCTFDPTGTPCGETTQVCDPCSFPGPCTETATVDCTCTSYACAGATCAPSSSSCQDTCTRETDGEQCLINGICADGQCIQCDFPPCPIPIQTPL